MRFSIIVPVYNIEEYISSCVDSILTQSFGDYECILVDDGSTDSSGQQCDCYAQEHPEHIKTYHKENGGLSDARNYGVERASGDYLIFVDGDDYIHEKTLEWMESRIVDAGPEMILSEGCYTVEGERITEQIRFSEKEMLSFGKGRNVCTGAEALAYTVSIGNNWSAWGKAYKREFWISNHFSYIKGRIAEDMPLTDRVLFCADRVSMIPAYTFYRYREGSLYRSISKKYMENILLNLQDWETFFAEGIFPKELETSYRSLLASSYVDDVYVWLYHLKRPQRKAIWEQVYDFRKYICLWDTEKGRKIRKLYGLLGFRGTAILLNLRKRYWGKKNYSIK